jgi:hypothetical protein
LSASRCTIGKNLDEERDMPRLVMVGELEDSTTWEERFRSHAGLFSRLFADIGMNVIHFTVTDDGRFVLHSEPSDLDKYFELVESPEIQAAMVEDGVKRETVEIHVLDKELAF